MKTGMKKLASSKQEKQGGIYKMGDRVSISLRMATK